MVRVTTEKTTKHTIPIKDLRKALRLPKWGRLTLSNINVKRDNQWFKPDEAHVAFDDGVNDAALVFTNYQTRESKKRL